MKRIIFIFVVATIFWSCNPKNQLVAQLGKPAPAYTFIDIVNTNQEEISLSDFKGKTVILEFWATWCGPCIPAIKKLDKLKSEFGDDLEILAISHEDTNRLKKFAEKNNLQLTVISDEEHTATFPYKVIPHSIIIDKKGVIRAITNPKNITSKVIRELINKDEIALEVKDDFYIDPNLKVKDIKTLTEKGYRIALKGYDQEKRGGSKILKNDQDKVNGIQLMNNNIPSMYQTLFDVASPNRVIYSDGLSSKDFPFEKEHQYNLDIEVSDEYLKTWKQIGIDFLNQELAINARITEKDLDCYVLSKTEDLVQESKEEKSEYSFMGTIFKTKKIKMHRVAEYIENFTAIPVVDKTGLMGQYDINLDWSSDDPKTLHKELAKYGLKLEKSSKKLPVRVMEVYKKKDVSSI